MVFIGKINKDGEDLVLVRVQETRYFPKTQWVYVFTHFDTIILLLSIYYFNRHLNLMEVIEKNWKM